MGLLDSFKQDKPINVAEDILLTKDEVCAKLKVSRNTLWRLEKEGKIKSYLLQSSTTGQARAKRYKLADINALLTPSLERVD